MPARLVSFAALHNVRLGIIPFETACVVAPTRGFWLLDSERVMVGTFSAELNLAQQLKAASKATAKANG
jgi:hypothetical protein